MKGKEEDENQINASGSFVCQRTNYSLPEQFSRLAEFTSSVVVFFICHLISWRFVKNSSKRLEMDFCSSFGKRAKQDLSERNVFKSTDYIGVAIQAIHRLEKSISLD